LAGGKGVTVARDRAEARAAIEAAFGGAFGAAGRRVVLEERLYGPEVSLFALCDGTHVRALATARDYKRAFDGDEGPNTGGMGAVSPAPNLPESAVTEAMGAIVEPAIKALKARGIDYVGVLYAGLMLTGEGPKLIEFNVRFGDPEAQVVLPRLDSDAYDLFAATAQGSLAEARLELTAEAAVGVVVASDGYPGAISAGRPLLGLDKVAAAGACVLHAGTRRDGETVLSDGGRILAVVAMGKDTEEARSIAYEALSSLDAPGVFFRSDIGA